MVKLDRSWNSFQLASSAPPRSVGGCTIDCPLPQGCFSEALVRITPNINSVIRPILSKSEKACSHQIGAYALAGSQARRQNKYAYVAYGRLRCLVTARPLRHADACRSSVCCNLRIGHLGLGLGQRLPKLGRKDFCSRDPARVQSGNILSKGVVLPSVKLFSAHLWSEWCAGIE